MDRARRRTTKENTATHNGFISFGMTMEYWVSSFSVLTAEGFFDWRVWRKVRREREREKVCV